MTTIAYKSGIMSADTQSTNGNRKLLGTKKIFETSAFLVGIGGAMPLIDPFLAWFIEAEEQTTTDGCDPPTMHYKLSPDLPGDDVCAIVVCRSSRMVYHLDANGHGFSVGTDAETAIGSGEEYALGAMAAGASAQDAVKIAMLYDPYTGGEITSKCVRRPGVRVTVL